MSRPQKRPRVVMVSITFDPEPGCMWGLSLGRELMKRGYEVVALTAIPWYPLGKFYPGYKLKLWQWEDMDGIKVLRLPLFPSHDFSAARRILTYLSFMVTGSLLGVPLIGRSTIAMYFDNLPTTGFIVWLLRLLRRSKSFQHVADIWPDTVTESGMLPKRLVPITERIVGGWCKFLYKRHEQITVLSPGFKKKLLERGVPAEKIRVVYNWANEIMFHPEAANSELAEELGFTGRVNVVYAGNVGPLQSLGAVIKAAKLLQDEAPEFQLVIIGMGPSIESLRSEAAALEVKNVRFFDRRPMEEMNAINAIADGLLVHLKSGPLTDCTIPGKTQVAMACGKPLLLGVSGDASQLVLESQGGLVMEPENVDSIAAAFRQFCRLSPEERAQMGQNARSYYEEKLSLAVAVDEVDGLLKAMLSKAE